VEEDKIEMGEETKKQKPAGGAIKIAVKKLHKGETLDTTLASDTMKEIMRGEATPAQMGAFLALLSLDRCTSGIIHALANVMRENATVPALPKDSGMLVDIVGTGGDGQDTFNISTTAGLVAAAAGVKIVKHGNRAATSKSGAADVLEAMGVHLEVAPTEVAAIVEASGFVFLFARSYHPAMRHVGPVRLELGIRTVFNILGPLTNPARPHGMVCGVFSPSLGPQFVEVFKMLGMRRALVVHGCEVLDEFSIAGPSLVWELKPDGSITHYKVTPDDFGVETHALSEVAGGSAEENAEEIKALFSGGGRVAVRDMVLMNAAAALYVGEQVSDFKSGVALARPTLTDGRAIKVANSYVAASKGEKGSNLS